MSKKVTPQLSHSFQVVFLVSVQEEYNGTHESAHEYKRIVMESTSGVGSFGWTRRYRYIVRVQIE